MAAVCDPQTAPSVFDQLVVKNAELTLTGIDLRQACVELAAKNGSGDHIRRRIRQALFPRRGATRGSSR